MLHTITPALQTYAWGGYDYIPHLLGQTSDNTPKAELWYGDHPQAPALLDGIPFNDWLHAHPEALSARARARYGIRLPYLLKILDVRQALSIQLHPDKTQAEQGYAREQQAQTPPEKRNYVDDNHKPESMIALSEFWLLHGFSPPALICERLRARPSLAPLAAQLEQEGIAATYARIMHATQDELAAWLHPLLAQTAPTTVSDNPDYWLHDTVRNMHIPAERLDPGLLSFYLFNIVRLRPGEGIYQRARLPHAYLRGQNIEIMAASNNVLRAGLTPKHIDIPELLRIIDPAPVTPAILPPGRHYPAPVDDYLLHTARLDDGETLEHHAAQATTLLVVDGAVSAGKQHIRRGEAVFLPAGSRARLQAQQPAYLIIAGHR